MVLVIRRITYAKKTGQIRRVKAQDQGYTRRHGLESREYVSKRVS